MTDTAAMSRLGMVLVNASEPTKEYAPGIYENMPAEEYHRIDAASNSRLGYLKRSPAHLRAYLDEPQIDRDYFRVGRAFHAAVLEPELFTAKYCAGPVGDRRTKAVKEAWDMLTVERGEGYVLKLDEYNAIMRMRESINDHRARKLFIGTGHNELTLIWIDPATGVKCKARLDRYCPKILNGCVVDLKSTKDASRREFERSFYSTRIHNQGAFYLAGCKANNLPAEAFVVCAVEKERPNAVALYNIIEAALDAGQQENEHLLRIYGECQASGHWPGYGEEVADITLPDWAWSQIEAATGENAA